MYIRPNSAHCTFRERHGLLCCPSCFLTKSHIMPVLTWSPRQHWKVHLPSEVMLWSWHHPQKCCNSIYEETLLSREFSCSEDWKIRNDVIPQTRNEYNKIFYLETSEDKGAAIDLNLSMVCLGGRNHSALVTEQLYGYAEPGTMLKELWLITVEAHLDLCLDPWFLLPPIAVPQNFTFH